MKAITRLPIEIPEVEVHMKYEVWHLPSGVPSMRQEKEACIIAAFVSEGDAERFVAEKGSESDCDKSHFRIVEN